jgi:excisionase family DNA binding protein
MLDADRLVDRPGIGRHHGLGTGALHAAGSGESPVPLPFDGPGGGRVTVRVPELIDIETLAACLDDSVRHIRRLVAERRIPYVKVGHFIRFDPDEIKMWLEKRRVSER